MKAESVFKKYALTNTSKKAQWIVAVQTEMGPTFKVH